MINIEESSIHAAFNELFDFGPSTRNNLSGVTPPQNPLSSLRTRVFCCPAPRAGQLRARWKADTARTNC